MKHNRHSIQSRPVRPPTAFSSKGPARLDAGAIGLLDAAPARLRLMRLRREFPHVLNRIAAAWSDPLRMLVVMQDLIDGDRPQRAGFPSAVLLELTAVRDHYFVVRHPTLAPLIRGGF